MGKKDAVVRLEPKLLVSEDVLNIPDSKINAPIDIARDPQLEVEITGIVEWLKTKIKDAGLLGLVLGVSGGIDSAVVGALIKKAFPEQSLGLIMPCYSSDQDISDAHLVCDTLGLRKLVINLEDPHQAILDKVNKGLAQFYTPDEIGGNHRITDANLKARLRMSTLYAVANSRNYLVAGTDNAAEVYTGYFTKYGDGGVDLLPLSQFNKREVRALAQILGIPENIIAKAPTAGLWTGQTDEVEMGVSYTEIDDFLEGKSVPKSAHQRIKHLHHISEHKRVLPPVYQRSKAKKVLGTPDVPSVP
jgi:NAD+ synthase